MWGAALAQKAGIRVLVLNILPGCRAYANLVASLGLNFLVNKMGIYITFLE